MHTHIVGLYHVFPLFIVECLTFAVEIPLKQFS